MSVKLMTEYHLEFLSLNGGCTGSSESTLVKMLHCWKSRVTPHIVLQLAWRRIHILSYVSVESIIKAFKGNNLILYFITY